MIALDLPASAALLLALLQRSPRCYLDLAEAGFMPAIIHQAAADLAAAGEVVIVGERGVWLAEEERRVA